MAQIKTLEQFRDYLKRRMGWPVLQVEVDDTQFDQHIEDTIQFFNRHNTGEGNILEYMMFSTSANIATYNVSGQGIQGAFDMELSIGIDGINTLFAPTHELLYSDFVRKGSILGTDSPDYSPGLTVTSYDTAMLYLKEIKNHFGRGYTVQYNPNRETLTINPTPSQNMTGVIYVYRREDAINLYNHELIKELAYGKSMIQWGLHLGKYTATMPDGISMNGSDIRAIGEVAVEKAEARIMAESAPVDFFIG